jgi:glycosyltransferase involved in cell wall biosynthesis
MANILWWGRSDPEYSRNRLVLKLLAKLGWEMDFFHPISSQTGFFEAYLHRLNRPDLIWVPCFRHRDIYSASKWARKWRVPLIIDPLISAYEKEVYEKNKWPPNTRRAENKRQNEIELFSKADIVVADTPAHADYFNQTLRVSADKICVLYVGADTDMFYPIPFKTIKPPFEILFYGSFIKLQGVDVIVEAAKKTRDIEAKWVLIGDGDLKAETMQAAQGTTNIDFEPWIPFDQLSARISKGHILLGIFGTTLKSSLVIPNKVFQTMATGRPVITRASDAYPDTMRNSDIVGWVPGGDSDALASVVRKWLEFPALLQKRGQETRRLFDAFFSEQTLETQLNDILIKI